MERLELHIRGRVQGVGFRWQAQQEARRLGLSGWVRNRADGSVQLVAEGDQAALDSLAAWAARGPARARVDQCDAVRSAAAGTLNGFRITG